MKKSLSKARAKDMDNLFQYPVSYEKLNLLDYPKIVKVPMDFSTVEKNVSGCCSLVYVYLDMLTGINEENGRLKPFHLFL